MADKAQRAKRPTRQAHAGRQATLFYGPLSAITCDAPANRNNDILSRMRYRLDRLSTVREAQL